MNEANNGKMLFEAARSAIEAKLEQGQLSDLKPKIDASQYHGIFVTIKDRQGRLRGCIGQVVPIEQPLLDAVAHFACAAAFQDPRFTPISKAEWPEMVLEISLLNTPHPVKDIAVLDPKVDGIIVRSGAKLGLLLPDIDGVDNVDQQIAICCQKAGIHRSEEISLESFKVSKFEE